MAWASARHAHSHAMLARPGQRVAARGRIGMMAEAGRCTDPYIDHEVPVGDRSRNAVEFVPAGKHVFEQNPRRTA